MAGHAPWSEPTWHPPAEQRIREELARVGRPVTGPIAEVKRWGRCCIKTAPTERGTVWVKHALRLPPGEEVVFETLAPRWSDRLPGLVACWPGAVAMDALPGQELREDAPREQWILAATSLAEFASGESAHVDEWLALGTRDRRPACWGPAVRELLESPALNGLDSTTRSQLDSLVPDFIARYEDAFGDTATLVHQDSGCCNIHIANGRVTLFDWSDVVVGHSVFMCDRLLDQVPKDDREAVISAYLQPLGLSREAFGAMRRSNVLHEVLRYHDELSYLRVEDESYAHLTKAVLSQLRVLVQHELHLRE